MEVLEQMRMLLREKAILFGQYEQETLRLDTDDLDAVDDIVDAVQARQALIDKITGTEDCRYRGSIGLRRALFSYWEKSV